MQPKLNGIRALYQNGNFQSRDELPFPAGLLDHLVKPLQGIANLLEIDETTILDGELYKHGWPLQRINAAVTPVRQAPTEDTLQIEYHIFDRANFNLTFRDRIVLFDWPSHKLTHVFTEKAKTAEEADIYYAEFVSQGYEGMMYRLGDCPYTVPKQPILFPAIPGCRSIRSGFLSDKDNRCWHLLKRKDWQDDEFICIDVVEGEGKLQGMLGAIICQTKSAKRFNVGSGLTDSERQHYWANPPIGRKIKVKYLVLSNNGIPLNPTILCIL